MAKRIAFIYGRNVLNAAPLQYMPFGYNPLKLLANEGYLIDVYLTQTKTNFYSDDLPKNVRINFLDKPFLWKLGGGGKFLIIISLYVRWLLFFKRYSEVWGCGQIGIILSGIIAKQKNIPFFLLSDEFPGMSQIRNYRERREIEMFERCSYFFVPDESRRHETSKITNIPSQKGFTLPNIPLLSTRNVFSNTDWKKKLGLSHTKEIVLYAGGRGMENCLEAILSCFPFTAEDFVLVMVCNDDFLPKSNVYKHERIIWIDTLLGDEELNSLISQSLCCVSIYLDRYKLEFVGTSSGKMMRSLFFYTPVITSNYFSLDFVTEKGMGIQLTSAYELVDALKVIYEKRHLFEKNIEANISNYYFESYWDKFTTSINYK